MINPMYYPSLYGAYLPVRRFETGGATTPTSSSTATTYLDPDMKPYYAEIAATAEGLAKEPRQLYEDPRLAGFTPEQDAAFAGIASLRTPTEYNTASGLYGQAGNYSAGSITEPTALGGASFSTIGDTTNTLGSASFSPTFANYQELGGANFTNPADLNFNAAAAQQYINPYATGVLDVSARKLREEAARNIALGGLKSAGLGGYAGSGNAINAAAVNRALTTGVGDIYSKGLAEAYANAQAQFNADRTARMDQERAIEKARQDIYGTNLSAYERAAKQRLDEERAAEEAERSRYAANIRAKQDQLKLRLDQQAEAEKARETIYGLNADKALQAFKANEEARQWAAENKRKNAEGLMSLAGQRQTSDLGRLAALEQVGRTKQALRQRQYDIDYENFIEGREWQRNLLSWANNIIKGLPAGQAETRYNYDAPPSMVNQLAGLAGAFLSGSKVAGS